MKKKEGSAQRKPANPGAADETQPSFEQLLQRLEQIVERLESGEAGLDEALRLYDEAVALRKSCEQRLRTAEKRIEQLAAEQSEDDDAAAQE